MSEPARPRLRAYGIRCGSLPTGARNAITDVAGVRVGHFTLIEGAHIRTGATAVLPHGGNLYQDKVPAGLFVGNGFGKLTGGSQIEELGEIETPILLTNTLAVPEAAAALIAYTLEQPGNGEVRSVNPVVGETNDGWLNDIRARPLTITHMREAIERSTGGEVAEGCVGAGTGTIAFGWKGGIGTSSRRLPDAQGAYTVGALVQSNFGGALTLCGVPMGAGQPRASADGSIMMVLATNAPLSDRNLRRLAARAMAGLARTGAAFSNGSGDYALAFSTCPDTLRTPERRATVTRYPDLPNDLLSPLFLAAIEATEEAIYNSLLTATPMTGHRGAVEALPVADLPARLRRYGRLEPE